MPCLTWWEVPVEGYTHFRGMNAPFHKLETRNGCEIGLQPAYYLHS